MAEERRANEVSITRIDEETIKLELNSAVTFDVNSSTINPAFRNSLRKIAQSLRDYPDTYVEIQGHTDSQGSADYNYDLSVRRADAVGDFLVGNGISFSRIDTIGFGETAPIADNRTSLGRAANRRVELFLRSQ